jgi:hypothetical protein
MDNSFKKLSSANASVIMEGLDEDRKVDPAYLVRREAQEVLDAV